MTYYTPDLTGTLPAYAVTGDLYTIFTSNQRVEFNNSIFLESMSIFVVGTGNVAFIEGVDWTIDDTVDIDYTTMSQMKNIDPSFNQTLIKSILIISPTPVPYQITCAYQQIYPVPSKIAVSQNGAVELTPDLIVEIMQRLTNAEVTLGGVQNSFAGTQATPKLLPIDISESIPSNFINEIQTVNVFQNQNVIRPTCGSFYQDSVVLTITGNPIPLVAGTDYVIFGADLPKTKITTNTSGVYNFILVLKQYAGNINVGYHAFGGDVTLYDLNAIYSEVSNINTYLSTMNFLTQSSLGLSPTFQQLITRISTLETNMRSLINSGNPNYSDVTGNGTVAVQKIRSVDNNLHWWTIASLYTVAGSSAVVTADRMHFRMQTENSNLSADVYVNVDLALVNNPFTIDSISVNQDLGYIPFTSYGIDPVMMPQFRIIYNTGSGIQSGILLQIGLELSSLVETISIQDLSGSESAWILTPGNTTAVLPQDNTIVLPNTTQTWVSTYSGSIQVARMMPNKTGYLAWGGALPVSGMSTSGTNLTGVLIDSNFIVSDIKKVRLQFTETGDTTHVITVDIPVAVFSTPGTTSGSGVIQNTPTNNTVIITAASVTISGSSVTLTVTPSIIPSGTTLVLRHFLLLTN